MKTEQWNIKCCKCNKFLFTERRIHPKWKSSRIEYVDGDYDDYYFDEVTDESYCIGCARKYKKLLDFGADGIQRNCSKILECLQGKLIVFDEVV